MLRTLPAVEGWFEADPTPALLAGRCTGCGTYTFPRREGLCPNPACGATDDEQVRLEGPATIWSYATNHYDPPAPAVVPAPYTVVAATLPGAELTVLGLLAPDADPADLRVGGEVELVVRDLYVDDDGAVRTVWAWSPTGGGAA